MSSSWIVEAVNALLPIQGHRFELAPVTDALVEDGYLRGTVTVTIVAEDGGIEDVLQNEGPILSASQMTAVDLDQQLARWRDSVAARPLEQVRVWLPSQLMPADYPPEARRAQEDAEFAAWREQRGLPGVEVMGHALEMAVAEWPRVRDEVLRTYLCLLPGSLAAVAALLSVLRGPAGPRLTYFTWVPTGPLRLFDGGATSGLPDFHYPLQPPEMVPLVVDDHMVWAAWVDHPGQLPSRFVQHDFKGGDSVDAVDGSLLDALRAQVEGSFDAGAVDLEHEHEARYVLAMIDAARST